MASDFLDNRFYRYSSNPSSSNVASKRDTHLSPGGATHAHRHGTLTCPACMCSACAAWAFLPLCLVPPPALGAFLMSRDAVFRTNSSDEDITTKVFPFDVDEALANGNGQANAGVSHFASHGSVIGRTSSHERIGRLASVFMHAPREKTLKPCLKAVSSYGPGSLKALKKLGSTALDGGAEDGQKRQRVRFFIPKARADGLAGWLTVLSPDSGLVAAWRTFLVLPMAYEMWAGGFRLALGTPQQYWLRSLDVASDLCFVVDGLMSLNTAVRKRDQEGVGGLNRMDSTLIRKRVRIAEIYFKNSFPFLILPSGFYLTVTFILAMEEEAQQQNPNLWLWWISSLPRLVFRVRYLFQYFKAMDMNLNVAVSSMQAVKFFLMIFMSAHWIGSMYFFAARVQPGDAPTWMDGLPQIFPMFEKRTAFLTAKSLSHYILCLYKGVDGLVSIGYFPIVPTNTLEMILAVSVQYLAIWVSAYILGSLFHYLLVSQKDALKEAHTKKMDDLMTFMEERHVPMVTRKRLVEYFEFQYKKAVQRKSSAALKLPRSLEVKVANARFSPTLFKCCNRGLGKERGPFFGCSPQFLNAMVTKLRPVFLMPGDQFMRSSDMVLELCFVSSGYAEVMDGESVKRIIRSDVDTPSIVGEVSFFLGVQQQHSVRAPESSDIELLVLSKEHGEELFRDYPEQVSPPLLPSSLLLSFIFRVPSHVHPLSRLLAKRKTQKGHGAKGARATTHRPRAPVRSRAPPRPRTDQLTLRRFHSKKSSTPTSSRNSTWTPTATISNRTRATRRKTPMRMRCARSSKRP